MSKNGECDTTIVRNTVKEINAMGHNRIVVIKSTVPPGTTEQLNKECDSISVVFNPEFLTEANFIDDFKNQTRIIVGGKRPASTKVKNIFRKAFPKTPIIKTSATVAECVKYFTNTFLATKVSFSNEIYDICSKVQVDYNKVAECVVLDRRLGSSHWLVLPMNLGKCALALM